MPESACGPTSLVEVADHFLSIHDDLLDDDEDLPDALDEETALEIIRREYVSGTCAAFAIALHDLTGYQIVGINGGLHVAVMTPDGLIMDFVGTSAPRDVFRRYGMRRPPVLPWTREEAVDHVLMGEEEGDPWDDISVARWVRDRLARWHP
jgi:hypothetical protein